MACVLLKSGEKNNCGKGVPDLSIYIGGEETQAGLGCSGMLHKVAIWSSRGGDR